MAQLTRTELALLIESKLPTNFQNAITAKDVRDVLNDMVDSTTIVFDEKIVYDQLDSSVVGQTAGTLAAGDDPRFAALGQLTSFSSRGAAATTNIPAGSNYIYTAGYYSQGDGGQSLYIKIGTPSVPQPYQFQSVDGAWWQLIPNPDGINVRQLGCKGDGVTDDRANFQNAINYAQDPGVNTVIRVPPGLYVLSTATDGTNFYCLLLNGLSPVLGTDAEACAISPLDSTNINLNPIRIVPANATCDGFRIADISIVGNASTSGLRQGASGILVSTRAASQGLAKPIFERLIIGQGYVNSVSSSLPRPGAAIFFFNDETQNPNGGVFGAKIQDCRNLGGGVKFNQSGDQNIIENCIISGENNASINFHCIGVDVSLCSTDGGAGFFTMRDLTIVCKGGGYRIATCVNFSAENVYMECFGADVGIPYTRPDTSTGYALAVIDGGGGATIGQGGIKGNRFSPQGGVSTLVTANLYIANAAHITIEQDNTFFAATATSYAVEFASNCNDNTSKADRFVGFSTGFNYRDAGTRNQFNDTTSPALVNGFANTGSGTSPFKVGRDYLGQIRLYGNITKAGATSGTGISTLPVGYRPPDTKFIPVYATGGSIVIGAVEMFANGNLLYFGQTCDQIDLSGVVFRNY